MHVNISHKPSFFFFFFFFLLLLLLSLLFLLLNYRNSFVLNNIVFESRRHRCSIDAITLPIKLLTTLYLDSLHGQRKRLQLSFVLQSKPNWIWIVFLSVSIDWFYTVIVMSCTVFSILVFVILALSGTSVAGKWGLIVNHDHLFMIDNY